jgi:DtxR family transcriptional regulator, Mn-dependent transcriptional regulator
VTAAKANDELTAPVEDYLKVIYEIERRAGAAATNDIAQRLSIAPASVSGMVRRLADQGLLAHERYKGVRLTSAGRRAALRTIRRHRVIEAYLAGALGYPWDRVHAEAERLEHAASDELVDRMAAAIGEPDVDPHGAPIPTREGAVDERRLISLGELAVGQRARVIRVSDEDPGMLRYLAALDIVPGAELVIETREPFGGPISIRIGAVLRSVGPELAGHVRVEEAATASVVKVDGSSARRRKEPRPRRTE